MELVAIGVEAERQKVATSTDGMAGRVISSIIDHEEIVDLLF